MLVRVLGAIDVVDVGAPSGGAHTIGSRSQRVVLAVLAAHATTLVPGDVLVDALWGDRPPASAVTSLRTYVSRLRRLLGDRLEGAAGGYRLVLADDELDARHFERLVDDAAAGGPGQGLGPVEHALALWRGRPFGDLDDLDALRPTTLRLTERWLAARELHAAALLATGREPDAVAAAEALLAEHPLREQAWAVLVDALAATGRTTEALRAVQRAAAVLADAGLEPGPDLRRAEHGALVVERRPASRSTVTVPRSSLVGRDHDREVVGRMLVDHPLVTLVGPGGVGKTRLARTVAGDLAERFDLGARFVALAGVDDGADVPAAVAGALDLTVGAEGTDAALAAVADLDLLVVLDNCEHVVEAAAAVVDRMVAGGGGVRVLATSREPLAVDGEQRWPVRPLPIDGEVGAEALFVDRARAVRPDLVLGDDERRLVRRICRDLDGLPLALEMAAAAVAVLPLGELAERLADTPEPPASGRRDVADRHRTLADVVGWSTRLLDASDRELLDEMAVFSGAVTPADVAGVTARDDPLPALCRLAERSLLVAEPSVHDARFRMLRTVRQAVRVGAPIGRELQRRHARWLTEAVVAADADLRGRDELVGHERLESLLDDARAAMAWSAAHDPATATRLGAHLAVYGQSRLRDEVLGWLERSAERLGADAAGSLDAAVLAGAAHRAMSRGDLGRGRALAERAAEAADASETPPAIAHEVLADAQLYAGELALARQTAERGRELARRAGDRLGEVVCLVNSVLASAYLGDHARAERVLADAPVDAELPPSGRGWLRYAEGERLLDRDPAAALPALDEAIGLASAVGNRYLESVARVSAASLRSRTDDPRAACEPFVELLAHWRAHGDRTHLLTTLRNAVVLLDRLGMHERAAELLGSVLGDAVAPTYGDERRLLDEALAHARDRLGTDEVERRLGVGRARTLDEAGRAAEWWLAEG